MLNSSKTKCMYPLLLLSLLVGSQSFADISEYYGRDVLHLQEMPEEYSDIQVKRIRAISRYLTHGAIAGLGSALSVPLVGQALTHWWIEIETNQSDVWFVAHYTGPKRKKAGGKLDIRLIQTKSESDSEREGKREGHENESCSLKVKDSFYPENLYVSEVFSWLQEQQEKSEYKMLGNNCKDLANDFFERFAGRKIFRHPNQATMDVAAGCVNLPNNLDSIAPTISKELRSTVNGVAFLAEQRGGCVLQ